MSLSKCIMLLIFSVILFTVGYAESALDSANTGWKSGVARIKITPSKHMWMAGYGSRTHPSTGLLSDLWAKALVIQDKSGKQVALITLDLLGITRDASESIKTRIEQKYHLKKADILINCSHTHSGPVLEGALTSIYDIDDRERNLIKTYTQWLIDQVVILVDRSMSNLQPATVYSGAGVTRFQVNRRNNKENELTDLTVLNGPVDYSVPVLKIVGNKGKLLAVAFGYACHATVLNGYDWSGDYPGFAQLELEKMYKGTMALFFQGAGANLNPLPRRTVTLAQQYGRELAAAVDRVLHEEMQLSQGAIATAYNEINLELSAPPEKQQLQTQSDALTGYEKRWADQLLSNLDHGGKLPTTYPYPIQIWKLGDQLVYALGGELVVDYSIALKKTFGSKIFVLGYSNDVMAYIPSASILKEGGYEGSSSQKVYGMPSDWSPTVEPMILKETVRLAEMLGVSPIK